MPSMVITAHGGRGAGTSTGTYVVPKGVTIYFFTDDALIMSEGGQNPDGSMHGAMFLENLLMTTHPDELSAQGFATEVKRAFDTVPNYTASGAAATDPNFTHPTGCYWVGNDPANGPCIPMQEGVEYRLSQLIGGGGAPNSPVFYWLCCRYSPRNSNNMRVVGSSSDTFAYQDEASATGLKPSQIRALGGRWR